MTLVLRRRGFLGGMLAGVSLLAAPAIIRPGLLMPIQPPLRETRYWQLSKVYLTEPETELELPWFVTRLGTTWQQEENSTLVRGEFLPPDRRLVLAKTLIEVPAGVDLSSIGNDWNVERASSSRLSRL